MTTDAEIEKMIEEKGSTARRITREDLEKLIIGEYTQTADKMFPGAPILPGMHVYTICLLVLRNGFIVDGHSAPAIPENFNAELGRMLARQHAVNKIWELEGYRLKSELAEGSEEGENEPPLCVALTRAEV